MAKKRLNKKVALIGTAVFLFLVLIAIGAILYFSRDPEKFIRDGNTAMKVADEAVDEQIKTEEYEKAVRNYNKARNLAKTDSLRIEMLFKLADVHIKTKQWRPLMGCWNAIIRIDPENVKARLGRLEYVYITADSGIPQLWQEVTSQASEFIEVAEDANLLMEDTAKWRTFEIEEKGVGGEQIGSYLYLLRGRANLEIAMLGAVTDPDELLTRAIDDLQKVRELEPGNVDVYWHLARAALTKGQILASRGNLEERNKAIEQAEELLEQAVEVAGADPEAHINLLSMKRILAGREGVEQLQALEPEYLLLVQKFASSAEAYSALAIFYQLRPENIGKAIEAAEKAVELDKENVAYAITKANLHYRNFSIHGQKQEIYKAVEVAENTLTLPNAQDRPGPRQLVNKRNRITLWSFLANCYIEQVLEPCEVRTDAQTQVWIANAEQAVHEIEQISGSGENPEVIKWRGMLELAKGNRHRAIKNLYAAYEQLKASQRADAMLSYTLAKIFADTTEVGAVAQFLVSALNARIALSKPEAILDFAEILLKLKGWTRAISIIDMFEKEFGANQRSRILRLRAYIGTNKFDEVEEELAKRQPDDPDAIKINIALVERKIRQVQIQGRMEESSDVVLQRLKAAEKETVELEDPELMKAELKSYRDTWVELLEKLLPIEPNAVGENSIVAVCDNYISEGKIERAKAIVNQFLEYFPDSVIGLFYKQILSEPEPDKVSQQRRNEIEKQILSNISDPMRRSLNLGVFYQRHNEPNEAAIEFKKVLKIENTQESPVEKPVSGRSKEIADMQRLAAGHLFDIALGTKDWELASAIGGLARRENFDDCEGKFFAARLAMAKEQYKDALAELEECLKQRPVFSHGFRLRSIINAALGNEHASIGDAQKAVSLNPLNGNIAKMLAFALYQRNERLGDNVSSNQIIETRAALDSAVALNPGDSQLLSGYAEYISTTEPLRALAIRQSLQEAAPSVKNAVLLGRLATKMALQEKEAEHKEVLFAIAASSFKQASKIDPHDKAMLYEYAEYYQASGQDKKARQLLLKSEDQKLLWNHYIRSGEFEDARKVLERLYQSEAKDNNVVKGLLLVAEKTADKEAAKKYSEELLLLEDNVENHLFQIQTFLRIGLIKEAEYKLQGLNEKYPDEPRSLLLEAWLAMKQGRLERALELTNRNLETDQDNAVAWRLRGKINFFMADYDQAIIDLKRSKLLSDEPVTRIALTKAYLRVWRMEDAITELKNTIDEPGAPMEGRALLEQIYLRLGRGRELEKLYDVTL